jgi:4-hydroxy-3-methylbut-2-en-1-yl diphosphate synthase IspG/GcpE
MQTLANLKEEIPMPKTALKRCEEATVKATVCPSCAREVKALFRIVSRFAADKGLM